MKKVLILSFSLLVLAGCQTAVPAPSDQNSNLNVSQNDNSKNENVNINVRMANPASTNCLEKGGKLEGRTDENGGQFSLCVFNDDTRCEEWSYFRGECSPGKNIIVWDPKKDQEISLPFKIQGQARVFENNFNYLLKDEKGNVLISGFSMSNAPDMGKFGDFTVEIASLNKLPISSKVILEVFDYSAKDGAVIDLVSIPLILNFTDYTKINLYFNNDKLDPQITCTKVFPVSRYIPKTTAVGQAAVSLLLKGPSSEEFSNNYRTSLNDNVKLNRLIIENKIAKVDFDQQLQNQVGGSCRVGAISAQITQTLKQFPTVDKVIISIEGQTEDILQP